MFRCLSGSDGECQFWHIKLLNVAKEWLKCRREVIEEIVKYAKVYDDISNVAYKSSIGAEEININLSWLNAIELRAFALRIVYPNIRYAVAILTNSKRTSRFVPILME